MQTEKINVRAEAVPLVAGKKTFMKKLGVHEEHWLQTEYIRPMCVREISTGARDIDCIC